MIRNSGAATAFETIVSCCVILTLIGTFSISAQRVLMAAREAALKNELYNLRLSLELYRIFNKSSPEDLSDLYRAPKYFVLVNRLDSERKLVDPFGKRYYYNPKTGRIRSESERYKDW